MGVDAALTIRRHLYTALWRLGLNIVVRDEVERGRDGYQPYAFGEAETIEKPPEADFVGRLPDQFEAVRVPIVFDQPLVFTADNVKLVGGAATAVDSRGHIIMDTVAPTFDDGKPGFSALPVGLLLLGRSTPGRKVDGSLCSLVSPFCHIYGHWLMETLPRLEGLEHYCRVTGDSPVLLVPSRPADWQVDSLELLGFEKSEIVEWDGRATRIDRLVVPAFRRKRSWPEPAALKWLRSRLTIGAVAQGSSPPQSSRRIYLARQAGRHVVNEDELVDALRPLGFERCVAEDLTFADEVLLFDDAEAIVGVHGSGLVNVVLSGRGPVVVDLSADWWTPVILQVCVAVGARYTRVFCRNEVGRGGLLRRDANLVVDVPGVLAALARGGITEDE